MGSAKRKRRKRLKNEWAEFQSQHGLTDGDIKLARRTGYPLKRFEEWVADEGGGSGVSISQQIQKIHGEWQERNVARQVESDADLVESEMKPTIKLKHDPQWAKAKSVCRLNREDIDKAKQLGLSPQALIKNIPSPNQPWKTPVKVWIQLLYEERSGSLRNSSGG